MYHDFYNIAYKIRDFWEWKFSLHLIFKTAKLSNAVIFSDSVSILQSLEKPNPDNTYLIKINQVLSSLDFRVTFEWVSRTLRYSW